MKSLSLITITIMAMCLLIYSMAPADELFDELNPNDLPAFTDLIHEWSPNADVIQIGDQVISEIRSVWLDKGNGDTMEVNSSYIKEGDIARALLIEQDRNGYWVTDKIILFEGKGLEDALKKIPLSSREKYLESRQ